MIAVKGSNQINEVYLVIKQVIDSIPHAQQTAMLDELHLLNIATATHRQEQDAAHCLPTITEEVV